MLDSVRTRTFIRYGRLCFALSVLLAVPTIARAQAVPKYAKVYSARVGLNPAATLADLEALARKTGSVELLTLPASGDPCEPVKRELIRFGDPGAGYPGFAVRSTAFLAAQRAAGRAAAIAGTTTTRATIAVAGTPVDFTWARPALAGDPASVELAAAGAVIARNVFHPVAGAADPFTRPRVIHVVGMDQRSDIVQVFEYFDKRPAVKLEPPASFLPLDPDAFGETLYSDPLTGDASLAVLTDPVNFGSPTRGWPGFHFDTGWLPGGSLCASPLQGRIFANAAAGIGAHVDGDFRLDTSARTLRPGSGGGNVWIDLGFDAGGQGSLCFNFPWPLPDIDWQFTLAGIDARVNDTTTFNSFLLNGCAEARDSKSVPALCALPPIPIPLLSGNACLTLGGSAAFQMCGSSISVSDGNSFTSEGQSRGVTISCSGYHRIANYNESGTVTAGIVVGLSIGFDITIWSWSWDPSYTFDVLSLNAPNLNFSSSGLDFNVDSCGNGVCDCGETCNSCPSDCDPTCGDGRCECGESPSSCCRDCAECCSSGDCNDGLFCNGSETCVNGSCQPGTNPCNCNLSDADCTDCCNEAQNNCTGNEPPGSPCNDGQFCNGTDTCNSSGSCSNHTGDPCPGCDGDSDCSESCNEALNNCTANDSNACGCNDGLFCTQTDTCSSGTCNGTGNPCTGGPECADTCDEGADTCNLPPGTPCTDDGNVCTDNECDGGGACVGISNTDPCDDGLFCTQTDTCSNGTCIGTGDPCTGGPECADACNEPADNCFDPMSTVCSDTTPDNCFAAFCNGAGACDQDASQRLAGDACGDPASTECDNSDTCDAVGVCQPNHAPNDTPCPDGLFCNGEETCQSGVCTDGDSIPGCCKVDTECDNSDACDGIETCDVVNNTCVLGIPLDCDDGITCTTDTCDPLMGCVNTPVDAACDDGVFCNGPEVCDPVLDCQAGGPVVCPAVECEDTCNEQQRSCNIPKGTPCMSDGNPCTADVCDGQGICGQPLPDGAACGDPADTECDNPDACDGTGTCQPNHEPASLVCRADAGECDVAEFCDGAGGCPVDGFEPPGTACGDSGDTVCDDPDTCDGTGICQPNHEPASLVCRADAGKCDVAEFCDGAGGCPVDGFEPDGTACGNQDDTDCDNPDSCDGNGTCDPRHEPVATPCGDQADDDCTDPDTCDALGVCLDNHEPDGTFCEDDSFCNGTETCQDGACRDGPDPCIDLVQCDEEDDVCPCTGDEDCDDHVACTIDSCGAADLCNSTPDDSACDNGLFCDGIETCDAVADCQSGAALCGDGFDCTVDTCDEDLDECHNDVESGNCLIDGACYADEAVNPGNSCQSCQPLTDALLWSPRPDGTSCDDGNSCTSGDACSNGACTGTAIPNCPPSPCVPNCGGRECGGNGCGGLCGTCTAPETCDTTSGQCECVPDCQGLECGDDGCGGSCGFCSDDGVFCNGAEQCVGGTCEAGTAPCVGADLCDEDNEACLPCNVELDDGRVVVCHLPPGNPDNPQTLVINASALNAHLNHGDYEGACNCPCLTNDDCSESQACSANGICGRDTDADGVPDEDDSCISSPAGCSPEPDGCCEFTLSSPGQGGSPLRYLEYTELCLFATASSEPSPEPDCIMVLPGDAPAVLFGFWNGVPESQRTNNPLMLTMDSDKLVTVNWQNLPCVPGASPCGVCGDGVCPAMILIMMGWVHLRFVAPSRRAHARGRSGRG